jgi:hypothetical protein
MFLAWDLTLGTGRATMALVSGLALRIRMVGRLVVRAGHDLVTYGVQVLRRWSEFRAGLHRAARRARGRFLATRLRLRLRVTRARRRVL